MASIAMIGQDEHCILITETLLLALNSLSRKTLALVRPNIRHRQTARPGDPPIGNIGGIGSCFWQMPHLAPSVPPKPCRCLFHISAVIPDSYLTLSFCIVFESTPRSATCSDVAFWPKASHRRHLRAWLQPIFKITIKGAQLVLFFLFALLICSKESSNLRLVAIDSAQLDGKLVQELN